MGDESLLYMNIKCCENCRWAIYDSVPYGSTSVDYLSGCEKEDEITEEELECHCWEEVKYE